MELLVLALALGLSFGIALAGTHAALAALFFLMARSHAAYGTMTARPSISE